MMHGTKVSPPSLTGAAGLAFFEGELQVRMGSQPARLALGAPDTPTAVRTQELQQDEQRTSMHLAFSELLWHLLQPWA